MINQNILRSFLNLQKNFEKIYIKQTSIADTTEFLRKNPNVKKISNEHFNLWNAEISLDKIINLDKILKF